MASPKPWSVSVFERERPHLTDFVRREVAPRLPAQAAQQAQQATLVIRAPVKSGKREMVEYLAVRDLGPGADPASRGTVHVFISAWHRTADEEQRKELELHNVKVFSINSKEKAAECAQWLARSRTQPHSDRHIVAHLDECDHGSGEKQLLSIVWPALGASGITLLLYSATPQEVYFAAAAAAPRIYIEYTPPAGYCGPGRFLAEGLVFDALPFFIERPAGSQTSTYTLAQGREIIAALREGIVRDPARNFIVLRLTYVLAGPHALAGADAGADEPGRRQNKAIYKFVKFIDTFPELADFAIVVDKMDGHGIPHPARVTSEKIQWSNPAWWRRQASGIPTLIVIDQTSSRSTEWACHDRVFATHDYRAASRVYTAISQAQERVNHYDSKYGTGFQPILVYGHKKTFQLSAGQIDYGTYLAPQWIVADQSRAEVAEGAVAVPNAPTYRIENIYTRDAHPAYPDAMDSVAADMALQCLIGVVSVSSRVAGTVKETHEICAEWHPCRSNEWDRFLTVLAGLHRRGYTGKDRFKNVFARKEAKPVPGTDLWRGCVSSWYDRTEGPDGRWKVLDYQEIKDQTWGVREDKARLTICYNDNVLGIAIRYHTDAKVVTTTLASKNTMYSV